MRRLFLDRRSALTPRISGWERYTREISSRAGNLPFVTLGNRSGTSMASRVLTDQVILPWEARKYEAVHYPSFPPSPTVRGVRLAYTLYDLTWWRYPETASRAGLRYYRPQAELAVKRADIVFTISATVSAEIQDRFGVPEHRIVVTPLGTSLPLDVAPEPSRRPFILAVGSVEPRKNLGRVVQAFAMSGLDASHELVLVGRRAWGALPPGVRLHEGVTDRELASLYQQADATVCMSLYEGFGLPVLESIAAGTRVLCSDIPVFHEVAGDRANYADPLSVEAIAAALHELLDRPEPEDADVAWARSMTWDRTFEAVVDGYTRLLGAAP